MWPKCRFWRTAWTPTMSSSSVAVLTSMCGWVRIQRRQKRNNQCKFQTAFCRSWEGSKWPALIRSRRVRSTNTNASWTSWKHGEGMVECKETNLDKNASWMKVKHGEGTIEQSVLEILCPAHEQWWCPHLKSEEPSLWGSHLNVCWIKVERELQHPCAYCRHT